MTINSGTRCTNGACPCPCHQGTNQSPVIDLHTHPKDDFLRAERAIGSLEHAANDIMRERDALRADLARAQEENKQLRELIATGQSRGAEISPVVRDVFAAASRVGAERDKLTLDLAACVAALTDAIQSVEAGQRGYMGDHYVRSPQIGEDEIERWRAALARVQP